MSHLDDDVLAGLAMGEPLSVTDQAHLDECARCAAVARELGDLADRAGTLNHPGPLQAPPPRVWEAITAELESNERPAVASGVTSLSSRRARSAWSWAAAAAVGAIVGGVGVGLWMARPEPTTVVASTELVVLADDSAAGTARVERAADGSEVLVVTTSVTEAPGADLEVWLIDPNIEGMVSLGFLTQEESTFALPAGFVLADFPIVDISVEPRDGVPTHSGDSITRGVFGTSA